MGTVSVSPLNLPHSPLLMKITVLLALASLSLMAQARRLPQHGQQTSRRELEKEANNKIHHGPLYKKALTDEEFAKKKARYYKKLRLGEKGEHRLANTKHDQDDISLQDLTATPARSQIKHKPTNFNKVMKLKSLKPNKKMEKVYKKMLAKEKLRMKRKHFKKQLKHQTP